MAYIQSFSLYLLYLYSNWFKGSVYDSKAVKTDCYCSGRRNIFLICDDIYCFKIVTHLYEQLSIEIRDNQIMLIIHKITKLPLTHIHGIVKH